MDTMRDKLGTTTGQPGVSPDPSLFVEERGRDRVPSWRSDTATSDPITSGLEPLRTIVPRVWDSLTSPDAPECRATRAVGVGVMDKYADFRVQIDAVDRGTFSPWYRCTLTGTETGRQVVAERPVVPLFALLAAFKQVRTQFPDTLRPTETP